MVIGVGGAVVVPVPLVPGGGVLGLVPPSPPPLVPELPFVPGVFVPGVCPLGVVAVPLGSLVPPGVFGTTTRFGGPEGGSRSRGGRPLPSVGVKAGGPATTGGPAGGITGGVLEVPGGVPVGHAAVVKFRMLPLALWGVSSVPVTRKKYWVPQVNPVTTWLTDPPEELVEVVFGLGLEVTPASVVDHWNVRVAQVGPAANDPFSVAEVAVIPVAGFVVTDRVGQAVVEKLWTSPTFVVEGDALSVPSMRK